MYRFRTWIRTRAISFSFKIACENISFSSLLAAGDVSRFTRRFLRAKRPKWRTARRNGCFRRLHSKQIYMKSFNIHFPLFYFSIIRNRLRVIMHRHKKKKKRKRKRNTEEVKIEPHRIPQNSLWILSPGTEKKMTCRITLRMMKFRKLIPLYHKRVDLYLW